MIVPMKKISLVVLENERREALKNLRKLGVLHVEEVSGSSEELSSYKLQNSTIEKALGILTEIKLGKKEAPKQTLIGKEAAFDIAKKVIALTEEKKTCFDRITADSVELERFAKWGGVNPLDFAELSEKGLNLALYEIPGDKYALIGEEARTIVLGKDKSEIRFVLVSEKPFVVNERPAGIPAEAYQVPLPRLSTADLQKEISDSKKRIVEIEAELKSSVQYRDSLKSSTGAIAKDIELVNLYSGMGIEEKLSWITGFVPVDSMAAFEAFAKEQKWAYAASDPTEDDNVPTKLKNNKLVSLIYPLTDFLGTVPGYHEYDISGWFLAFFTIFFGMIFGDGGYGALVTAVALIFILKSVLVAKKFLRCWALSFFWAWLPWSGERSHVPGSACSLSSFQNGSSLFLFRRFQMPTLMFSGFLSGQLTPRPALWELPRTFRFSALRLLLFSFAWLILREWQDTLLTNSTD